MIKIESATLSLGRGRGLEMAEAKGCRIVCRHGVLWITQDRDSTDVILLPGQSFTVSRPGLTVVHAFEQARLSLDSLHHEPWRPRLAKWFARLGGAAA